MTSQNGPSADRRCTATAARCGVEKRRARLCATADIGQRPVSDQFHAESAAGQPTFRLRSAVLRRAREPEERPHQTLKVPEYLAKPFHLFTHIVAPNTALADYDPEYHFLLSYKLDESIPALKGLGPFGMSGGPVYELPPISNTWSPTQGKLIGVQKAVYSKQKLLKVSRIKNVLMLVQELV